MWWSVECLVGVCVCVFVLDEHECVTKCECGGLISVWLVGLLGWWTSMNVLQSVSVVVCRVFGWCLHLCVCVGRA